MTVTEFVAASGTARTCDGSKVASTVVPSRSSVTARSSCSVTSFLLRIAASTCWASALRVRVGSISSRCAIMDSIVPHFSMSASAPLSPIPLTPGTLSAVSPTSAR